MAQAVVAYLDPQEPPCESGRPTVQQQSGLSLVATNTYHINIERSVQFITRVRKAVKRELTLYSPQ